MIITRLEPYAKGRVAVYLNDEFAFVLYKGELSKYGLENGVELNEQLYREILENTLFMRARKRGMNLLLKMDRTVKDVSDKLTEGGYPVEAVHDAIEYLKSYHYLDDRRYAVEYIRSKQSSLSRKVILHKLSEKGVPGEIIEDAYAEIVEDNDSYGSEFDEVSNPEIALIRKLMRKKCNNISSIEYEDKQKLFSYLARKGFAISDIEIVFRQEQDIT